MVPGHDTNYLALLHIHSKYQPVLQVLPAGFQKPYSCPLAFSQHHNVICITDNIYSPSVHLLVEFVQADVCKQR